MGDCKSYGVSKTVTEVGRYGVKNEILTVLKMNYLKSIYKAFNPAYMNNINSERTSLASHVLPV